MISLCIPKYPNISEKISQNDILMLSPLSLAPYPTPPGPSSSARRRRRPRRRRRGRRRGRPLFQSPPGRRRRSPAGRQRRKRRVPVLLQARARSRRCSKPGPAAAGAGVARGPANAATSQTSRKPDRTIRRIYIRIAMDING